MIDARRRGSKDVYRWIWRNGRYLIFSSVALYLGIVTLRNGLVLSNYAAIKWAMMAGNAVVAFYVWRSQFIRDLFEEFPPPEKEEEAEPETDIQGRPGNDPHGNFLLAPRPPQARSQDRPRAARQRRIIAKTLPEGR